MTPDNPLIENGKMELLTFEGTLTKRERFAKDMMQSLCVNPSWDGNIRITANDSVALADALILALKSTPEPE